MNKMMIPTVLVSLSLSIPSLARDYNSHKSDWAKVTNVEPIIRMIEHSEPQKRCWNERTYYDQPRQHHNNYTNTIMGGIIGGAIGNAVGHKKRNKQVGAVVGSLLGASVGHSLSNNDRRINSNYHSQHHTRRCDIEERITYKEQVVGYHVSYRYRGDHYKTKMSNHPGKKIKVRVSVEPY